MMLRMKTSIYVEGIFAFTFNICILCKVLNGQDEHCSISGIEGVKSMIFEYIFSNDVGNGQTSKIF